MSRLAKSGHLARTELDFESAPNQLQTVLQRIVDDVVDSLGCIGAMVATVEPNNTLPVQAYAIDFNPTLFRQLEERLGVSMIGPNSIVYLDDEKYQDNLSVRAVKGDEGKPKSFIVSNHLYDLFRPIVNKPLSDLAQKLTGIKQVIAVPFSLEDEVVGNLFAATRSEFSNRDIDFLTAFGFQAAIAIQGQRQLAETQALERVVLALQANIANETQILQTVVDAVVNKLGYAGAILTTLEADNTLPVRAYAFDVPFEVVKGIEKNAGVNLTDPDVGVSLDDETCQNNLGVRAIRNVVNGQLENFAVSDQLYDLLRPVIDKPLLDTAQQLIGVKQVIALPFFLENEVVGNLFVASHKPKFSEREIYLLTTFAQQAAVGIRNARLYQKAEERRQIAQMFGRMAFGSAANVHALRNHLGAVRTFLSLVELLPHLSPEQQKELLDSSLDIKNHLNRATDILDNLHEPWRQTPDVPTEVNNCLIWAVRKIYPSITLDMSKGKVQVEENVAIHKLLNQNLPMIKTSPDMMTEAFKIIIKNAIEAVKEKAEAVGETFEGQLWLQTRLVDETTLEVIIRDNAMGINLQDLSKIFEMGWSTKEGTGMGFGLFWTKDYIEGLNGEIKVESIWQEETTFSIRLPYKTQQPDD